MQNTNLDPAVLLQGLEKLVRTSPDTARQSGLPKTQTQMTPSTAAPTPELVQSVAEQQAPVASMPPPYTSSATNGSGLRPSGFAEETKAAPGSEDTWRMARRNSFNCSAAAGGLVAAAAARQAPAHAGASDSLTKTRETRCGIVQLAEPQVPLHRLRWELNPNRDSRYRAGPRLYLARRVRADVPFMLER